MRDWLYVEDHARALQLVMEEGAVGETYNVGGRCDMTIIAVVRQICQLLDARVEKHPDSIERFESLIDFVDDRPGHDFRYGLDASKIETGLGWKPYETFGSGLKKTVDWYLQNREWCDQVLDDSNLGEGVGSDKSSSI